MRQQGLTLVEVMIAMLLVLVASAGALAVVARGRAAQRIGESVATLEETTDAAIAILAEELRMAGYLGLTPPGGPVIGSSPAGAAEAAGLEVAGGCGASLAHDVAVAVAAADGAYAITAAVPLRCGAGPDRRVVAGSDTLTVRRASATGAAPDAGRLQMDTHLQGTRLMSDGVALPGGDRRIHDLEVSIFYVSADSTARRGWPSLRRKRLVGGARPAFQDEELVTGVEDLQVEIGLDDSTDPDDTVDRWITPGESASGSTPRAVRLWLRARSELPENPPVFYPARAYSNRTLAAGSDRFRHQLSSRVVALRNLQGWP